MAVFKDKRSGKWRFRIWIQLLDNTRKRITGKPTVDTRAAALEAERAAVELYRNPERALHRAALAIETMEPSASKEPTIGKLIDLMTKGGTHDGETIAPHDEGSESANHTRACLLNAFVRPRFKDMRPSELRQSHYDAYRDAMRALPGMRKGTKASDQTVRNKMFALTGLLTWAVEEAKVIPPLERALVVRVKITKAKREDDDPEVQPVSESDLGKLIAAARWEPRYLFTILVAADAGLRAGEIIGAKHSDIRTEDGLTGILVQRSVSARNAVGLPKSGKTRFVPLSTRTLKAYARVPKRGDFILTRNEDDPSARRNVKRASEPGGHVGYTGWNKAIKSVYRNAGVRFGWSEAGTIQILHSLRHTYGTQLVADGVQPEMIQRLMGHGDYRTTQRYLKVTRAQLGVAVKRVFG